MIESVLRSNLLVDLTEEQHFKNILLLSEFFNTRSSLKTYFKDPQLVSSYSYFYVPTYLHKMEFILAQCPEYLKNSLKQKEFIDFGSGPGTFSISLFDQLKKDSGFHLVDQSSVMLDQAKKFMHALRVHSQFYNKDLTSLPKGEILFMGHSLNEMGLEKALTVINLLEPEIFFFIEPGTKDVFKDVLKLRRELLNRNYFSLYPCPGQMDCPFERKDKGWCHQILRQSLSTETQRIAQKVKLDRKIQPMVAHIYSKTTQKTFQRAHFVRFFKETKFSFVWEVCDQGKLVLFEFLKKKHSKTLLKRLKKMSVGEKFEYVIIKQKDDLKKQVVLSDKEKY